jgi:hypothetical protein
MKKTICFDIDNTICKTIKSNYKNSKPIVKNINCINDLYDQGHIIKIFTARYMGRNNDNKIKATKQGYALTKKQLLRWRVKHHKLIFGKPSYDLFIDDKSIFFNKNWITKIDKFL